MLDESKAHGACDARAPENVRIEQQNTSVITNNPASSQSIIRYVLDPQLWVIAVYRSGVHHD